MLAQNYEYTMPWEKEAMKCRTLTIISILVCFLSDDARGALLINGDFRGCRSVTEKFSFSGLAGGSCVGGEIESGPAVGEILEQSEVSFTLKHQVQNVFFVCNLLRIQSPLGMVLTADEK